MYVIIAHIASETLLVITIIVNCMQIQDVRIVLFFLCLLTGVLYFYLFIYLFFYFFQKIILHFGTYYIGT